MQHKRRGKKGSSIHDVVGRKIVGAGSQDRQTAEATGRCQRGWEQERVHRERLRRERPLLSAGPTNALHRLVGRVWLVPNPAFQANHILSSAQPLSLRSYGLNTDERNSQLSRL